MNESPKPGSPQENRKTLIQIDQEVGNIAEGGNATAFAIDHHEGSIQVNIQAEATAPPAPQEETLQKYLSWVIDQHRYLNPRGAMQTVRQVQVLLEEVYVSLEAEAEAPLSTLDRRLYEGELEDALMIRGYLPEEKEDLRENMLAKFARDEPCPSGKAEELGVLVKQNPKLVILGDPGAGKTTLLRYLALVHAQALRAGKSEAGDLGPARLPLYLHISTYAEHDGGRSLIDYLPACLCGEGEPDSALAGLVQKRLAAGVCLVLLDGLDEVIEPGQRAEIANQIDLFVRTHERAGNRFIVTSRVAGYRSAPLAGDIPHYRVRDMSDEQIRRFLAQWCHAVECFQTPDLSPEAQAAKAQAEIDGIIATIEKNPGVRRLAANPLLLRTLALIHRTGARLPQRRIELYRLAVDTLIRDWELARGIPVQALVREADATRLLSELAAWMHAEKPAGIATEGEARHKLSEVQGGLLGKEPDHPDVQAAVDDFLSRIRQHTGLFVERAPRRYGFMHLTFEEYFAARWLVARPRDAARRIRRKLHLPRWEEPILLAISFYGMEFPEDVDSLIEEAILGEHLGGPSPYEEILHRDLLFAVRCLGDQDLSIGLMQRLLGEFLKLWVDVSGAVNYYPLMERMERVMRTLPDTQAGVKLHNTLLAALQDKDEHFRLRATDALGINADQPNVVPVLLDTLWNEEESVAVRSRAALALSIAISQPKFISALLAYMQDEGQQIAKTTIKKLGKLILNPMATLAQLNDLRDENEYNRQIALGSLGIAVGRPEIASALLAALRDGSESIRRRANRTSAPLHITTGQPQDVSSMLTSLQNENKGIRSRAAYALGNATAQPGVVSALLAALQDASEAVRSRAAEALGNAAAQPGVVSALLAALRDESEAVRSNAAGALAQLSRQPSASNIETYPPQLAASLALPGLDSYGYAGGEWGKARDFLFRALLSVAPTPGEIGLTDR